jgi:TolB protein
VTYWQRIAVVSRAGGCRSVGGRSRTCARRSYGTTCDLQLVTSVVFVFVLVAAAAGATASGADGARERRQERLVFVHGERLRTLAPGGGPGRPLQVAKQRSAAPAWSPDGTQVAFVAERDGDRDLFLAHPDGTGVRAVSTTPRAEADPAWAPNGRALAYAADNRLIVVRLADGLRRRLVTAGVTIGNPTWSPDASTIAYSVARADGTAHLYVIAASGGRPKPLTSGGVTDTDPAWSPGGRYVAFVRRDEAVSPFARLHVIGPNGTGLRSLLDDSEPHADPAWSPRGNRVAFSRGSGGMAEIFTVALDG